MDDLKRTRFRLLTELYSFLFKKDIEVIKSDIKFPSPYGVIFILTVGYNLFKDILLVKFPSPYGVIFILTYYEEI